MSWCCSSPLFPLVNFPVWHGSGTGVEGLPGPGTGGGAGEAAFATVMLACGPAKPSAPGDQRQCGHTDRVYELSSRRIGLWSTGRLLSLPGGRRVKLVVNGRYLFVSDRVERQQMVE